MNNFYNDNKEYCKTEEQYNNYEINYSDEEYSNIKKIFNYNSIFNIKIDNYNENCNDDDNEINKNYENIKKIKVLPKNKAFMLLHEDFIMNGWNLITNNNDCLIYIKNNRVLDEFIINISSKNKIYVTIPVSNSNVSYRTSFNSYFSACEFISMHLKHYEENINIINKK